MIERLGNGIARLFKRYMPDAFVFALVLTILTALGAVLGAKATIMETIESWYRGFWMLLEFGMQMVLILVTGYSIALSPLAKRLMNSLTGIVQTPGQVYPFVIIVGMLLSAVSWGWLVITAVMARELALRVKGVNYSYLIACVYFSGVIWVSGLSSSIPLLLNTEDNFLIEAGVLTTTIQTSETLGSILNLSIVIFALIVGPILFGLLVPKEGRELKDMLIKGDITEPSIAEEAEGMNLSTPAVSDKLNNSSILQYLVALMGGAYVIYYFTTNGFDLNLNIMIFIFIMLGMFLHRTPMRYGIAMKRSSMNISGILFQYPFYAGIMGIMIYTGLGELLAQKMASVGNMDTYPIFAFISGGIVNFAVPSAGGEFAVIGPTIIKAVQDIGAGLTEAELTEMIARASLSIAYGETLTNMLQPFYLLIILPVMGIGIKIQARDVMGYLVIPFIVFFIAWGLLVTFMPL
jgi:short-chain fatty acids transporter